VSVRLNSGGQSSLKIPGSNPGDPIPVIHVQDRAVLDSSGKYGANVLFTDMSNQLPRKNRWLSAIAIVAVALIIGFGIGTLYSSYNVPRSSSQVSQASQLYEIEFTQEGVCSPPLWEAPWEVVLNNLTTIIRPPNGTFPTVESGFKVSNSYENYSVIWFSVPNGTYTYSVFPQMELAQSGIVSVVGSDTVVQVHAATVLCTTVYPAG